MNINLKINTTKIFLILFNFHPSKNMPFLISKLDNPSPPNTSNHPKSSFLKPKLKFILPNLNFIPLIFGRFHIIIKTAIPFKLEHSHIPLIFQKHNQNPRIAPNINLTKDNHFSLTSNLIIQILGIHTHNKNAPLTILITNKNTFEVNITQSSSSLLINIF